MTNYQCGPVWWPAVALLAMAATLVSQVDLLEAVPVDSSSFTTAATRRMKRQSDNGSETSMDHYPTIRMQLDLLEDLMEFQYEDCHSQNCHSAKASTDKLTAGEAAQRLLTLVKEDQPEVSKNELLKNIELAKKVLARILRKLIESRLSRGQQDTLEGDVQEQVYESMEGDIDNCGRFFERLTGVEQKMHHNDSLDADDKTLIKQCAQRLKDTYELLEGHGGVSHSDEAIRDEDLIRAYVKQ